MGGGETMREKTSREAIRETARERERNREEKNEVDERYGISPSIYIPFFLPIFYLSVFACVHQSIYFLKVDSSVENRLQQKTVATKKELNSTMKMLVRKEICLTMVFPQKPLNRNLIEDLN